ncbi:MAG: M14 family zinc carboxypeptidase [Bdellovibrionota bacterium]
MFDAIISMFLFAAPSVTNYDKVVSTIQQIAQQNPANAKVISIGVNDQGVPIQALQIGNGEVGSLVVGTHHGNEYGSTAVALGVADSLAKNPVAGQTVYVVPVLNISGYNKFRRNETGVSGSHDSNRDYTSPCKSGASFNLKSTKALSDLLETKNIQISATLHTYFPAVVYPWGISTRDLSTPYDAKYIELANDATKESHYRVGNSTEVLYAADGTFEDYAYWKHGIWSLLFELGFSHSPDATSIKNMVEVNIPGIRRYLENAPKQRVSSHAFTGKCDGNVLQRIWLE